MFSMFAVAATMLASTASAQPAAADGMIHSAPRYMVLTDLTEADRDMVRTNAVATIPTFTGAFSYQGKSYKYTIVGGSPAAGGTTTIPTAIQPIKMVFTGTTDPATGKPYELDGTNRLNDVLNSPNWKTANYSVGNNMQFQDAVQNAQFYSTKGANYHLVFGTPRVLPLQTINVPAADATISTLSTGGIVAKVSLLWWQGQLASIRKAGGFKTTEIPLMLTDNVVLYEFSLSQCCVVGFHMAVDEWFVGMQTFAWASYVEPGTFSSDSFGDVTAISHELAELVNDPFATVFQMNYVPSWEFPGETKCQFNLETGDPVEVLANPSFPVVIGTTTYHPQTEALLQWFERETPSDAFNGAYSYPDMTALTAPAKDCGT
jgi:hypothetical protein